MPSPDPEQGGIFTSPVLPAGLQPGGRPPGPQPLGVQIRARGLRPPLHGPGLPGWPQRGPAPGGLVCAGLGVGPQSPAGPTSVPASLRHGTARWAHRQERQEPAGFKALGAPRHAAGRPGQRAARPQSRRKAMGTGSRALPHTKGPPNATRGSAPHGPGAHHQPEPCCQHSPWSCLQVAAAEKNSTRRCKSRITSGMARARQKRSDRDPPPGRRVRPSFFALE